MGPTSHWHGHWSLSSCPFTQMSQNIRDIWWISLITFQGKLRKQNLFGSSDCSLYVVTCNEHGSLPFHFHWCFSEIFHFCSHLTNPRLPLISCWPAGGIMQHELPPSVSNMQSPNFEILLTTLKKMRPPSSSSAADRFPQTELWPQLFVVFALQFCFLVIFWFHFLECFIQEKVGNATPLLQTVLAELNYGLNFLSTAHCSFLM